MKTMPFLLILATLLFACNSSEKKTHTREITQNYQTGELQIKRIVEFSADDTSVIDNITFEVYDKAGECMLRYNQKDNEDGPITWESEKLSSKIAFADAEESAFLAAIYDFVKEKDAAYAKGIKFSASSGVRFESEVGYAVFFPAEPKVEVKNANPTTIVDATSCKHNGFDYTVTVIADKSINDDAKFAEFYAGVTKTDPEIMTVEAEKTITLGGQQARHLKLKINVNNNPFYSQVAQLAYQRSVVSISIVGQEGFVDDAEFERFTSTFEFVK